MSDYDSDDVRRCTVGWQARGLIHRRSMVPGVLCRTADPFTVWGPTRRVAEWRRDGRERRTERRFEIQEWKKFKDDSD